MTDAEFLNAVAFGQLTPGPVTHTVALVGWAAAGLGGALLAAAVAFAPSFLVVLLGGERFGRLRESRAARAFLDGAGPAAVGRDPRRGGAARRRRSEECVAGRGAGRRAALLLALGAGRRCGRSRGGALAGLAVAVAGGPLP